MLRCQPIIRLLHHRWVTPRWNEPATEKSQMMAHRTGLSSTRHRTAHPRSGSSMSSPMALRSVHRTRATPHFAVSLVRRDEPGTTLVPRARPLSSSLSSLPPCNWRDREAFDHTHTHTHTHARHGHGARRSRHSGDGTRARVYDRLSVFIKPYTVSSFVSLCELCVPLRVTVCVVVK